MILTFHTGHEVNVEFDEVQHSYVVSQKLSDGDWSEWRPVNGCTTPLAMVPKDFLKPWVAKLVCNDTLTYVMNHPEVVDKLPQFFQDLEDYYNQTVGDDGKKVMTYYRFNKNWPWYKELKKAPERSSGIGKELGTWIHKAIEEYYKSDRKTKPVNTPETRGMWDSFMVFDNFFKPKADKEGLEFLVYSIMFGYSGQGDFRGYIGNKYCIGDWKSTNRSDSNTDGISTEYFYQLGGLAQAEFERTGVWPDDLFAANFDKKGEEPRVVFASDFGASPQDCAKAYISMFHAYHMNEIWDYKFRKRS